jgi:hypothetical protein
VIVFDQIRRKTMSAYFDHKEGIQNDALISEIDYVMKYWTEKGSLLDEHGTSN